MKPTYLLFVILGITSLACGVLSTPKTVVEVVTVTPVASSPTPFQPGGLIQTPVVVSQTPTLEPTQTQASSGIWAVIVPDTPQPGNSVSQNQVNYWPSETPTAEGFIQWMFPITTPTETSVSDQVVENQPDGVNPTPTYNYPEGVRPLPTVPGGAALWVLPTFPPTQVTPECDMDPWDYFFRPNGMDELYDLADKRDGKICAFKRLLYCPANLTVPYADWRLAKLSAAGLPDEGTDKDIVMYGRNVQNIAAIAGTTTDIPPDARIFIWEDEMWGLRISLLKYMCSDTEGRPILESGGVQLMLDFLKAHVQ